jgi:hypothetical protein
MKKNYFTYYKYPAIIFIIGVSLIGFLFLQKLDFYYSISLLGFLGIILEIIDRYLWKYKPFSWMFTIEDFSGTYEGEQIGYRMLQTGKKGKCKEVETKLHLTMIIHQTGSKITVSSFYYTSTKEKSSKSNSELVVVDLTKDGQHYEIVYHYQNKGNTQWDGFYGTTVLKLLRKNKTFEISGSYYTNRNPQTRGEFLNLTQISKNTSHPF